MTRRRVVPIVLTLCIGLGLTLAGFAGLVAWHEQRIEREFIRASQVRTESIDKGLEQLLGSLWAVGAFCARDEMIGRRDFQRFVANLGTSKKGIRAVAWAPMVHGSDVVKDERAVQQEGIAELPITERNREGQLVPAGQRVEYFPLFNIAPAQSSVLPLGFDLASDTTLLAALDRARNIGQITFARHISISEQPDQGHRFLFFIPINRDAPQTAGMGSQPTELLGMAVGFVHIGELVESALTQFTAGGAGIDLFLVDTQAPTGRKMLYFHPSRLRMSSADITRTSVPEQLPPLHYVHSPELAKKRWEVIATPAPGFHETDPGWLAWTTLLAGILITGLLTAYLSSVIQRSAQVERLVSARTRELSAANVSLDAEIMEREKNEEALRESEERYRMLVESMNEGLGIQNEQGVIDFVNDRLCEMLGYSRDDMVGHSITEFIGESNMPRWAELMNTRRQGIAEPYEGKMSHRDGSTVFVYVSPQVIRDATGQYKGSFGVFTNLTARKRAEEQLRKLSLAVEQSPNSVLITDRDGIIEYTNQTFSTVTGYTAEEARGQSANILKSGKMPLRVYQELWRRILSGQTWQGELTNRKKDGSLYLDYVAISPIVSDEGQITHYVGIQTDFTERRKAEERTRLHEAELAHNSRLSTMGEMASGLAHELNQPLAAIANYNAGGLQLIRSGRADPEKLALIFEKNAIQAQRAGEIIRRMRKFVTKGKSQRELVDINTLVQEVVEFSVFEIREREVSLELELADGLPRVVADGIQIEQVILNLLRNGIEAMDNQGTLRVRTHINDKQAIQITVQDSGPGLDAETTEHLFEPFYSTKVEGLGMGLAISRSIVESHGGRLWAETGDIQGGIFQFTLPLGRA